MRFVRVLVGAVPVAVLGAVLWLASPALAAFPGANGLLAVQPEAGQGIVLVAPDGRHAHRICATGAGCGAPRRPRWSPNGRALVFSAPSIKIIYPDGSCLDCQFGTAVNPAFEPGSALISFLRRGHLTIDGIDTIRKPSPLGGAVADAVWSANGGLAVVHGGVIWAGRPAHLRRIGAGSQPSWSPGGTAIAATQRGWIVIFRVRDGRVHRVARGTAPAYSPDGRSIAFVAPDHRLMIASAQRAHAVPRRVGNVRAVAVDWQPKPRGANPRCPVPPGSKVLADSTSALVFGNGEPLPVLDFSNAPPIAYMGCLRSDGRERLLERFTDNNVDGARSITSAVVAAPFAALVLRSADEHYGGQVDQVQVFDLRSGNLAGKRGGESAACGGYGSCATIDGVVVGSDGVSAAHVQTLDQVGWLSSPLDPVTCAPGTTVCVAADQTGRLLSTGDPTGGAGAWTSTNLPGPGARAVACPSASLCVAAGTAVYTSTDPTAARPSWTVTALAGSPSLANRMSCPTSSLCVMTRDGDGIATSTDPAGGSGSWSTATIDSGHPLVGLFCSARPECFAADITGTVFKSMDPTGGAGAWAASPGTPRFTAGSCPSSSLCVAVNGQQVLTSTDPAADNWATTTVADHLNDISCPSVSLCAAVGPSGRLETSTDPTSGMWTATTIDHARQLESISCPSVSLCVAVDSTGHAVVSTDPTGGASAWVPTLIDGDSCTDTTLCSVERIEASDGAGTHTVDSSETPGTATALAGLRLDGDELSWSHAGAPRSINLVP